MQQINDPETAVAVLHDPAFVVPPVPPAATVVMAGRTRNGGWELRVQYDGIDPGQLTTLRDACWRNVLNHGRTTGG